MDIIELERLAPAPIPLGLGFRAGAARIEITPPLGSWTAGWGPGIVPRKGLKCVGRLHARVLVLDDGHGERVALIAADLHAGFRYLAERTAALTADLGFHVGRVVLVGSHNHSGPGNLYGSAYFDAFCTSFPWVRGFHRELADALAERVAQAVRQACAALEPARVGHGQATVWSWTANRSLPAVLNNFVGQSEDEIRAQLAATYGAPPEVKALDRLAVDPRVSMLAATRLDGTPIGCFATFAGHASLVAREHGVLGADWFGAAQDFAESLLHSRSGATAVMALGAGAIGDADPRPPSVSLAELISLRQSSLGDNLLLVKQHGARFGAALVAAFERATHVAAQPRLTVRFVEARIRGETVPTERGLERMPEEARIGASTLAGSELGPGFLSEGLRDPGPPNLDDPHWPKVDDDLGMRIIRPVLEVLKYQPPQLPLRLVQVGSTAVVGVPGEPTMWLSHTLADKVGQALAGVTEVMIAGTCGDYAGYFTTAREYERQQYEGASTLWGRHTERWLHQAFERLAGSAPVIPQGVAKFVVEPFTGDKCVLRAQYVAAEAPPHGRPQLQKVGAALRISGALQGKAGASIALFEWGDWLRLEAPDGAALSVEPQLYLEELSSTVWWSVRLEQWAEYAGQTLTVVLAHPDGVGRFPLAVPS